MISQRLLLSSALLSTVLALAPPASAQSAPASASAQARPADAHEEALKTILLDTRVMAIARKQIPTQVKPGYARKLVDYFFRHHSDDALAAAYARHVAATVSPQDSAAALRVVRLPQMRAMMGEYELLAAQGPGRIAATPAIARLGAEIERSANPADLRAMAKMTAMSKGVTPFIAQQIRTQDNALAAQFMAMSAKMVKLSWKSDLKAEDIVHTPLGFEPIDRVAGVWIASLQRAAAAIEAQRLGYATLGFDSLLDARYMTSADGIARGRRIVDESERITQTYLAEVQDLYAERVEQLRVAMLELPSYSDKQVDAQASKKIGFLIELNENRQRRHAAYRRILSFAESRLGQTRLENEQLVFAADADIPVWMEMQNQVQQLYADDVEQHRVLQEAADKAGQALRGTL